MNNPSNPEMPHQNQNNSQIPAQIQTLADECPKLSRLRVNPGPTFIEYRMVFVGLKIAMMIIGAIFLISGLALIFTGILWGVFFSSDY